MRCPSCQALTTSDDNYCRRCGASLRIIEVPAVAGESRAVTVWDDARPAVTQGVMLLAAGALLRFALGRAGRAVLSRAISSTLSSDESLDPRQIIPFVGGKTEARRGDEIEILWYRRSRR